MEKDDMAAMPVIDREKCQGCGLCVSVCACGALRLEGHVVTMIAVDNCGWCALCEFVCPNGAISCPFEIVFEDNQ